MKLKSISRISMGMILSWEEKEGWVRINEKDEEWVLKEHLQIKRIKALFQLGYKINQLI